MQVFIVDSLEEALELVGRLARAGFQLITLSKEKDGRFRVTWAEAKGDCR